MQKDIDFKAINGQVAVLVPKEGVWKITRWLKKTERWKFHTFSAWELTNPNGFMARQTTNHLRSRRGYHGSREIPTSE